MEPLDPAVAANQQQKEDQEDHDLPSGSDLEEDLEKLAVEGKDGLEEP